MFLLLVHQRLNSFPGLLRNTTPENIFEGNLLYCKQLIHFVCLKWKNDHFEINHLIFLILQNKVPPEDEGGCCPNKNRRIVKITNYKFLIVKFDNLTTCWSLVCRVQRRTCTINIPVTFVDSLLTSSSTTFLCVWRTNDKSTSCLNFPQKITLDNPPSAKNPVLASFKWVKRVGSFGFMFHAQSYRVIGRIAS